MWKIAAALALTLAAPTAQAADIAALKAEGGMIIKGFAGELKGELEAGMKSGGPVAAIGACNAKAPEVAERAAKRSGWEVGRTSHKTRNPANAPDAFEQKVLANFLARLANGEKPDSLVHAEVVEQNGRKLFRMIKAIPTAEVCIGCHGGSEVTPEVEAKLKELYPDDQARGFKPGDIRGVFTLSKAL